MEQPNPSNFINKEELVYWIDKQFVQETAKERIGRNLDEDELKRFTKMIEFGLWHLVYDSIQIAIDEVSQG